MKEAFSGDEPIRIPWAVVHAFLRLTTGTRLFAEPFTTFEAAAIIDRWWSWQAVAPLEPGIHYWTILKNLVQTSNARGALISDAHIAALAIENDAAVCTTDRDFARFANVRVIDPLR